MKHIVIQFMRFVLITGTGAVGLIFSWPFLMSSARSMALSGIVFMSTCAGSLYDRIVQRKLTGMPIALRLLPALFATGIFFANNGEVAPLFVGISFYYLGETALHAGRPWLLPQP